MEFLVGQEVQPVHHQTELGAGLPGSVGGFSGLRAALGAQEALGEREVLVVASQPAKEFPRAVRPTPGPPHKSERGIGRDPAGREVLEDAALERAALRGTLRVDPAGPIGA